MRSGLVRRRTDAQMNHSLGRLGSVVTVYHLSPYSTIEPILRTCMVFYCYIMNHAISRFNIMSIVIKKGGVGKNWAFQNPWESMEKTFA
jgi:hypothetical protein